MEEKIITFITIVAWVLAVGSTIMVVLRLYMQSTYTELHEALDSIKGFKRSWPVKKPLIAAIISWAWIFTF